MIDMLVTTINRIFIASCQHICGFAHLGSQTTLICKSAICGASIDPNPPRVPTVFRGKVQLLQTWLILNKADLLPVNACGALIGISWSWVHYLL